MLPQAPATDSRGSTRGTPAANMVESGRAERASADLFRIAPMIGILRMARSRKCRILRDRRGQLRRCHRDLRVPEVDRPLLDVGHAHAGAGRRVGDGGLRSLLVVLVEDSLA